METVQNVVNTAVNTATKLIYGEQGQQQQDATSSAEQRSAHNETGGHEPISGVTGKGTADEPFDQGNAADNVKAGDQQASTSATASNNPSTGLTDEITNKLEKTSIQPMASETTQAQAHPSSNTATTGLTDNVTSKVDDTAVEPLATEGAQAQSTPSTFDGAKDANTANTGKAETDTAETDTHTRADTKATTERVAPNSEMDTDVQDPEKPKGSFNEGKEGAGLRAEDLIKETHSSTAREQEAMKKPAASTQPSKPADGATGKADSSSSPSSSTEEHKKVSKMEKLKEKLHLHHGNGNGNGK